MFNSEKIWKKNVGNRDESEVNGENKETNRRKISRFDFYLPFLCLIQIIFTITSTISLLNLLNVILTPILIIKSLSIYYIYFYLFVVFKGMDVDV